MNMHRELEVEEAVVQVRVNVGGNLHVQGVEGTTVRVESTHDEPLVEYTDGTVKIVCQGDAVLQVPRQFQLAIEEVAGDLRIDNLTGNTEVISSGGNVSVAGVGELNAQNVRGDLRVTQAAAVKAAVRGNAHINDVEGPVSISAKGDAHLQRTTGSASIECKGNAHLFEVTGEGIRVEAKGDAHFTRCSGEIAVNAAGNVHLHEITSQQVRAVAKGDVRVHFSETVGGQAKIVTSGNLHVRNGENMLRRGKGIYSFRFGQGDTVLSLVSKGNTLLEGVDVAEGDLRGISEDMSNLGTEMGAMGEELGAELGAMGAEMGREFGNLGRDIARQVQDKVQRKLQTKMKDLGKRTAKVEWGEGKSWNFNFGDMPAPPRPPQAPPPPAWDAPFDPVEEVETGEPVSEEERGLVLRMLEEGKISATEAATLLEALGDAE